MSEIEALLSEIESALQRSVRSGSIDGRLSFQWLSRLVKEFRARIAEKDARIAKLEAENRELKQGIGRLYTEEGNYTLVARVIADHAASKMKAALINKVREEAKYYAERERDAERNVSRDAVEQEKKLAFILSNFSAELADDLEKVEINV